MLKIYLKSSYKVWLIYTNKKNCSNEVTDSCSCTWWPLGHAGRLGCRNLKQPALSLLVKVEVLESAENRTINVWMVAFLFYFYTTK